MTADPQRPTEDGLIDDQRLVNKHGGVRYRRLFIKWTGKRCFRCHEHKSYSSLQIHHIDGNRSNNEPGNLSVLCEECHRSVHVDHPQSDDIAFRPNSIKQVLLSEWNGDEGMKYKCGYCGGYFDECSGGVHWERRCPLCEQPFRARRSR